MATVGTITARLGLDKRPFSSGLKSGSSELMGFAKKATGILAAAFAGKKIFDALSYGVKLAAENEKTRSSFETMLGSMTAAKNLMSEIEDFAASTPFQLDELNAGAKKLLAFGVGQDEIIGKMKMLGDIAAGTGKPIGDFVSIFGKVKATGKVGLESVNQLAERGVPIYSELAKTLGVTEKQMVKMISGGKVGFADLEKALMNTAGAGGIFAGGMEKQSKTAAGLWSTFKDNVSFAIRDVGEALINGFDFKGMLNSGISFAQGTRKAIQGLQPVFVAMSGFVKALIPDFAGTGSFVIQTFSTMLEYITTVFNFMEFAVGNFGDVWELATTSAALQMVRLGGVVVHFFTGVLPALFSWFSENWFSIWMTALDFTTTVMINIGKNIRNIMSEIWDFIASGGTARLDLAWTPILDGFKNTISEMPDIPERAIGQIETMLDQDVKRIGDKVGRGFAGFLQDKQAQFDSLIQTPDISVPETESTGTDVTGGKGEGITGEMKGASGLTVGSAETITAIAKARIAAQGAGSGANDVPKKQLTEQKKTNTELKKLVDKPAATIEMKVAKL